MGKKGDKYAPSTPEPGLQIDINSPISPTTNTPNTPNTSNTPNTPNTPTTPAGRVHDSHDVNAKDMLVDIGGGLLSAGKMLRKGSVFSLDMMNKENRKKVKGQLGGIVGSLMVDPVEEAERLNVVFDQPKLENLVSLIYYILFLGVFCIVLFIRVNTEEPYRMQHQMRVSEKNNSKSQFPSL